MFKFLLTRSCFGGRLEYLLTTLEQRSEVLKKDAAAVAASAAGVIASRDKDGGADDGIVPQSAHQGRGANMPSDIMDASETDPEPRITGSL